MVGENMRMGGGHLHVVTPLHDRVVSRETRAVLQREVRTFAAPIISFYVLVPDDTGARIASVTTTNGSALKIEDESGSFVLGIRNDVPERLARMLLASTDEVGATRHP